jgi:hypothetical protein
VLPREACLGWVLMSNHPHLVLQTTDTPLSLLLHRVQTGFASRFNARFARQGHVFQSRFGSRPIQDEGDLMNVIRYVHRNPLEAGLVRDVRELEDYAWSSYPALLGRRPPLPFEAASRTLALFGRDEHVARAQLRSWMEEVKNTATAPSTSASLTSIDAMIREVCANLAVREADLRAGRRSGRLPLARRIVCQRAARELGIRGREIARALGITPAAVSQALHRET